MVTSLTATTNNRGCLVGRKNGPQSNHKCCACSINSRLLHQQPPIGEESIAAQSSMATGYALRIAFVAVGD